MTKNLTTVATVLDALSNETRLQIFLILVKNCRDGIIPTEISRLMNNFPRNTLSFHLSLMVNAGLCESSRKGKEVYYRAKCEVIKEIADFLLSDCCRDVNCECGGGK